MRTTVFAATPPRYRAVPTIPRRRSRGCIVAVNGGTQDSPPNKHTSVTRRSTFQKKRQGGFLLLLEFQMCFRTSFAGGEMHRGAPRSELTSFPGQWVPATKQGGGGGGGGGGPPRIKVRPYTNLKALACLVPVPPMWASGRSGPAPRPRSGPGFFNNRTASQVTFRSTSKIFTVGGAKAVSPFERPVGLATGFRSGKHFCK